MRRLQTSAGRRARPLSRPSRPCRVAPSAARAAPPQSARTNRRAWPILLRDDFGEKRLVSGGVGHDEVSSANERCFASASPRDPGPNHTHAGRAGPLTQLCDPPRHPQARHRSPAASKAPLSPHEFASGGVTSRRWYTAPRPNMSVERPMSARRSTLQRSCGAPSSWTAQELKLEPERGLVHLARFAECRQGQGDNHLAELDRKAQRLRRRGDCDAVVDRLIHRGRLRFGLSCSAAPLRPRAFRVRLCAFGHRGTAWARATACGRASSSGFRRQESGGGPAAPLRGRRRVCMTSLLTRRRR